MPHDVIVAGLGGMGSAALMQLARSGARVLGLERFDIGHGQGSSHGHTRIIRKAYFEGPQYVPLVERAYALWREVERAAGMQLLHITGSLDVAPEGDVLVEGSIATCRAHGLPHEVLDRTALKRRVPLFDLPAGHIANFQPDGGFVLSDKAILAHLGLAMAAGAEVRIRDPLLDWEPTAGGGVRVRTATGTFEAGSLILAAGAWIGQLVPTLASRATPMKQAIGWFQPRNPALVAMGALPVFILQVEEGCFYGFPVFEHPGFKVGGPHFGREPLDPDDPDRTPSPRQVALIRAALARYMPEADGPPLTLRGCIYTVTPDEHFIIDRLPDSPQVVVVSPCSGHGFKFASAIGEVAARLALGRDPGLDLSLFALARLATAA